MFIVKSIRFTQYNVDDGKMYRYWDELPVYEDSGELLTEESLKGLLELVADKYEISIDYLPEITEVYKTKTTGELNVTIKYYACKNGNFSQDDVDESFLSEPDTYLTELELVIQKFKQAKITDSDISRYKQN